MKARLRIEAHGGKSGRGWDGSQRIGEIAADERGFEKKLDSEKRGGWAGISGEELNSGGVQR